MSLCTGTIPVPVQYSSLTRCNSSSECALVGIVSEHSENECQTQIPVLEAKVDQTCTQFGIW